MCTLHPKTLKTLNLNLDQSLQLANEKQSFSFTEPLEEYPSTLANSIRIILFSKVLKFSKIISSKSKNIVKDNGEYLGIFHLLK
jgi:hypothetical protein